MYLLNLGVKETLLSFLRGEVGLFEYLDANSRNLLDEIVKKGKITDELEQRLDSAIVNFKTGFKAK